MVDEETLNFRIPVRLGIGPLKIMPYCCIGPASEPSKFEERVRFSHKALKFHPICSVMASTVDCGSARLCSNHNLWIINTKTGQMVAAICKE